MRLTLRELLFSVFLWRKRITRFTGFIFGRDCKYMQKIETFMFTVALLFLFIAQARSLMVAKQTNTSSCKSSFG